MAIRAINNLSPDWYVPKSQENESDQTRVRLKPLSGEEYLEIMLEIAENPNGDLAVTGKGMRLAVRYGLVGWENFVGKDGDIPFSRGAIGLWPVTDLADIAQEILARSRVSEEQEKN